MQRLREDSAKEVNDLIRRVQLHDPAYQHYRGIANRRSDNSRQDRDDRSSYTSHRETSGYSVYSPRYTENTGNPYCFDRRETRFTEPGDADYRRSDNDGYRDWEGRRPDGRDQDDRRSDDRDRGGKRTERVEPYTPRTIASPIPSIRTEGGFKVVKLPDVLVFKGKDDEDYEKFRSMAMKKCNLGFEDEGSRIAYMESRIAGTAWTLVEDIKDPKDYMEWIYALDELYGHTLVDKIKEANK